MTGRNEPCRCGSGLKYKKCCGKGVPKGGSPYEKHPMMIRTEPRADKPVVSAHAFPAMLGIAAYGMMQRMRKREGSDA